MRVETAAFPDRVSQFSWLLWVNPVTPSTTTSPTAPARNATAGVPHAMASIMTMPNGSSPPDRKEQTARAAKLSFALRVGLAELVIAVRQQRTDLLIEIGLLRRLAAFARQYGQHTRLVGGPAATRCP